MIPEKVKVGGNVYSVSKIDGLRAKYNLLGQVRYPYNTIEIDAELAEDRQNNVIIHEILHAIMYEAGYDEQDEDMIRRAGNILFQVLSDNDFGWLRKIE